MHLLHAFQRSRRPAAPRTVHIVASVLLGALPALSGCFAGGLDLSQVPHGRVCFPEPPFRLHLLVEEAFHDDTGDAPTILGQLLVQGAKGMVQSSHLFSAVSGPDRGGSGKASSVSSTLRTVRLEGHVLSFSYFHDYRWLALYGIIVALPLVGVSAVALGLFLLGVPVYTDRGEITVELRLRDTKTGAILGTYRGQAESDFHHGLHNFNTYDLSFWEHPETLFGLAIRRSLERLVQDRAVYRRLAATTAPSSGR